MKKNILILFTAIILSLIIYLISTQINIPVGIEVIKPIIGDIHEYVECGGKIEISISDMKSYQIRANIGESQISKIELGQEVHITGEGFKGHSYKGSVSYISPIAKQTISNGYTDVTVEVIIELDNADSNIRSGYSANIKILTDKCENSIILPPESIISSGGDAYVYVFKNNTVKKIKIETGLENEDGTQINKGLDENDIVITDPLYNIENKRRYTPQ